MRKERERVTAQGLSLTTRTGAEIQGEDWSFFHHCYQTTYAKRSGHGGYLSREFFTDLCPQLGGIPVMVLAMLDGQPVAAALFFRSADTLYGRYWGCLEHHPCLHFELCYYQAIDFAIANQLSRVEAGAQGEHKLARGYLPVETHSLHWIADQGFARAVNDYLEAERAAVSEEIEVLTSWGPFRRDTREDHE